MFRKIDTKSLLLMTGFPLLRAMRFSKRIFVLPSITVYTTTRCNYRCEMCWINTPDRPKMENMEVGLLEKVLSECASMWVKPKIHFSGFGEPLVYQSIRQTMKLCRQYKLNWSMTTNGYLLDKYAEDLVLNSCSGINVSIHGDANLHNQTTGIRDAFERTVAGIKKLEQVKRYYKTLNPSVAINCVINNHNVLSLENVFMEFTDLPVNSITFQHLAFFKAELEKKETFLILEKSRLEYLSSFMEKMTGKRTGLKVNFFPKISPSNLEHYYTDLSYARPADCILPWLSVRLLPNGDLTMCGYWYGNVQNETLDEVMNSNKALKFRELVVNGKFESQACYRCCHQPY
jgi:MoaA/NifB/PqqE/SkfB family radical SAM enzyme